MDNITDFELIKVAESASIYRDLTAGKIIPKKIYHDLKSEIIDNHQFTLIFKYKDHFTQLYQHIGFALVLDESGEFFYIKEAQEGDSNEADENAFKVQVILMLLGRYYARSGRDLENIGRIDLGIDGSDLKALSDNDEYSDILITAKLTSNWSKVMEFLTDRLFAHRTGADRYFLNSAGMSFLYKLVDDYKEISAEH